jgi:hypothetical protein
MRFVDDTINSVGELISKLHNNLQNNNAPVWYRGQAYEGWQLIPKLLRGSISQSEVYLINRFKQNATLLLSKHPKDDFEWLFLMQHHSMATRLLDWSESPLVALYFAVTEEPSLDGSLWVLHPTVLNEKSNYRPDYPYEVPSFDDLALKNYLPEAVVSEHRSRLFPLAAISPRNSPRMQSQQGVFTISHRENTPIEDVGAPGADRDHVWRYIIPKNVKQSLSQELKILSFSRFQLFPELDSLSII